MHPPSDRAGGWLARSLFWGLTAAALGVGIIALLSVGWFLLMLALVVFVLSLLLGPRGLLGGIAGFVALETFVALFFQGLDLALSVNCNESACGGGQFSFLVMVSGLAPVVAIGFVGGVVGLALRALVRPGVQPPAAAT